MTGLVQIRVYAKINMQRLEYGDNIFPQSANRTWRKAGWSGGYAKCGWQSTEMIFTCFQVIQVIRNRKGLHYYTRDHESLPIYPTHER